MRPEVNWRDEIRLRNLRSTDLAYTLKWRNESRNAFLDTAEITMKEHREWYRRYKVKDSDHVFIIESNGTRVGQMAIYDIAGTDAEFGRMMIDKEQRHQGIAHRAMRLLLANLYDFTLRLVVKTDNSRAIKLYEDCGFRRDTSTHASVRHLVYMIRKPYLPRPSR